MEKLVELMSVTNTKSSRKMGHASANLLHEWLIQCADQINAQSTRAYRQMVHACARNSLEWQMGYADQTSASPSKYCYKMASAQNVQTTNMKMLLPNRVCRILAGPLRNFLYPEPVKNAPNLKGP